MGSSKTKGVFSNVFGFMFNQPIYKTLRQLCVIQVTAISANFILLWVLLSFYMDNAGDLDGSNVTAIFGFCGTIFATTWVALNNISRERDLEKVAKQN